MKITSTAQLLSVIVELGFFAVLRRFKDVVLVNDVPTLELNKPLTDALLSVDQADLSFGTQALDTLSVEDVAFLVATKSLKDISLSSDVTSLMTSRTASDISSTQDTIFTSLSKLLADPAVTSDITSFAFVKTIAEYAEAGYFLQDYIETNAIQTSDQLSLLVGFIRAFQEATVTEDAAVLQAAKALQDTGSSSDQLITDAAKVLADPAVLTDVAVLSGSIVLSVDEYGEAGYFGDDYIPSNAASASDILSRVVTYVRNAVDATDITDVARLVVVATAADTTGTADAQTLQVNQALTEDATTQDSTIFGMAVTYADSVAAADAMQRMLSKAIQDASVTTDSGFVFLHDYGASNYFSDDFVGTPTSF